MASWTIIETSYALQAAAPYAITTDFQVISILP